MKIGSIVETKACFKNLESIYGLPYPKKGDALTVAAIEPHPDYECRIKGINLLYFEELPNLPTGLCDKTILGELNFVELQLPEEIYEVLNSEYTI